MNVVGVAKSTAKYFELHQKEAQGQLHDLEEAYSQLDELERQRGEIWRQTSHDLRGSASIITSATALLAREGKGLNASGVRYLEILNTSLSSFQTLLNSMLEIARIQAGREKRHLSHFDASKLLRETAAVYEPIAEHKGLYFRVDGEPSLQVQGDPAKITRIVQNLIMNALKYTGRGGVTLSWKRGKQERPYPRWLFEVSDTGPGMAVAERSPLAQVLQDATHQVNDEKEGKPAGESTSPNLPDQPSGEGIGLSIVKGLCSLLDAELQLETAAGKGTTFTVLLPITYDV